MSGVPPLSALDHAINAAVTAAVSPLCEEIKRLRLEVAALRRALPPALVSVDVAAETLGVSLSTARRRVRDGTWPVKRDGRRVLVDLAALHGPTDVAVEEAFASLQHVHGSEVSTS